MRRSTSGALLGWGSDRWTEATPRTPPSAAKEPPMSRYADHEPACVDSPTDAIELVIDARSRDLGGFSGAARAAVGPPPARRPVRLLRPHGPPARFAVGQGIYGAPAPAHRARDADVPVRGRSTTATASARAADPAGRRQLDGRPGAASSTPSAATRRHGRSSHLHGVQCWLALPMEHEEERAPSFEHHPAATIPVVTRDGAVLRVIAGEAYGALAGRRPVADALRPRGARGGRDAPAARGARGARGLRDRRVGRLRGPALRERDDARVRAPERGRRSRALAEPR